MKITIKIGESFLEYSQPTKDTDYPHLTQSSKKKLTNDTPQV